MRVVEDRSEADTFRTAWDTSVLEEGPVLPQRLQMVVLVSPYRTVVLPLAHFLDWQSEHAFADKRVVVLLPHEEHPAWWEWPLQRGVPTRLRRQLRRDGSALQVIDLPHTRGSHA